jgi:predicted alpha/beta-fold hydrolase
MRHCWRRRTGWVGRCGTWGKHLATNRPTVYLVMVGFSFGGVLCGWGFGTIFDLGRIAMLMHSRLTMIFSTKNWEWITKTVAEWI